MKENIFLSDKNHTSNRYVIFEEDNITAWLYLTKTDSEQPEYDCFVYNRIGPIEKEDVINYSNGPCPILKKYSNNYSVQVDSEKSIEFNWSKDGNAVAVIINGKVFSVIDSKRESSFSISVSEDCAWAKKWNEEIYKEIFNIK